MGSSLSEALTLHGLTETGCVHCGLPAPRDEEYCCFGCELAARITEEANRDHSKTHNTLIFSVVLTMAVMMLSLFLYAEDIYDVSGDESFAWMRAGYRLLSLALATPVMWLAGVPLLKRALARLARAQMSMEALIATAAIAAYGLSVYNLLSGGTAVYFDSATAALVLATFGRYLEAKARSHAHAVLGPAVETAREPVEALIDGASVRLAPAQIRAGMHLFLDVDQTLPVDAELLEPVEVNLAVLTGESEPVALAAGARVAAGAVPVSGRLIAVARGEVGGSTLTRLEALAKRLKENPTHLQRLADRFARALTPAVFLLTGATFVYWTAQASIADGVITALAVVLVACPCTYAIATPLVHWLAIRRALKEGVLLRDSETLEALAPINRVAFDKTGTLTSPDLVVVSVETEDEPETRALVRALEQGTRHPIGRALLAWAGPGESTAIVEQRFIVGQGVEAKDEHGRRLMLGAQLTRDGEVLARFEIEEAVRPEARAALDALQGQGIGAVVLTGDRSGRAQTVAEALEIEVRSGLTPEAKLAELENMGEHVAMVGDGTNDAPSLARGVPSFSIGEASGLARGLARVTLLTPDLRLVPWSIALAKRAQGLCRALLIGSTAYNLLFLALAAGGLLRPVFAGISMLISSLLTLSFTLTVPSWAGPEARS